MFGLFPNSLYTPHVGQSGGRGLSPRLWSRVNGQALSPDGASNGYCLFDDFTSFGLCTAVAANVGYYTSSGGSYKSYEDTGSTVGQIKLLGGGIKFLHDATDNDEISMQAGGAAGAAFVIDKSAPKLLIYEARFRITTPSPLADNTLNLFLGLSEEGCAATNFIGDDGAMADKDYIGFRIAEGAGATLTFTYHCAGQTAQVPVTNCKGYNGSIVAGTWYKVGFVYDPISTNADRRLIAYIDNTEIAVKGDSGGTSAYVSKTSTEAATFPDAQLLSPIFATQSASAAAKQVDFDWYGVFQAG